MDSSPTGQRKRRHAAAIDGFAAVRVVQERGEPWPSEPMRLMLAGGRELRLPASMPARRLVELLAALERGV
jgi:hypothetical protein